MSSLINIYKVHVNADPEKVFSYVADLTLHGEWSDNLTVRSVSEGPIGIGS